MMRFSCLLAFTALFAAIAHVHGMQLDHTAPSKTAALARANGGSQPTDAQCESQGECLSNVCINDVCQQSSLGGGCYDDYDCLEGRCQSDVCQLIEEIGACTAGPQCRSGVCRTNGTCAQLGAGAGSPCHHDSDCARGKCTRLQSGLMAYCYESEPGEVCAPSQFTACTRGALCSNNRCRLSNGSQCSTRQQCQSGICQRGVCRASASL